MASAGRRSEEGRGSVPSMGLVDFILARLEADGTSKRQVAVKAGISRSRMGEILHRCAEKRSPMTLDEIAAVLDAIGASQLEATIAGELMGSATHTNINVQAVSAIASLLSELLQGLPEQLADIIEHIDGLEYDDVRREHGRRVRALVVRVFTDEYTGMAQRRGFRLAALDD